MPEFNNMTVVSAAQVLGNFHSHADLSVVELEWGIQGRCSQISKSAHIRDIAQIAIQECPAVFTQHGQVPMERALIDLALTAPPNQRDNADWTKLLAGLRLDGFEVCEESFETGETNFMGEARISKRLALRRMLPTSLPSVGIRDEHSELEVLLVSLGLNTAKGHFDQAVSAFSRGDWAASNAQIRSCFEAVVHETATKLGISPQSRMDLYLKEMGALSSPFLYSDYNEWHLQDQKPQYLKGLWARLHPQGSHPGLSEEDDCAFRLQIVAITLRLLLRRLDRECT